MKRRIAVASQQPHKALVIITPSRSLSLRTLLLDAEVCALTGGGRSQARNIA